MNENRRYASKASRTAPQLPTWIAGQDPPPNIGWRAVTITEPTIASLQIRAVGDDSLFQEARVSLMTEPVSDTTHVYSHKAVKSSINEPCSTKSATNHPG